MSLHDFLVPTFTNQLESLLRMLDKGVGHKGGDAQALLDARLAEDMLPLSSQIKIACAQATDGIARLLSQPISVTPDVTSLETAKSLITDTLAGLAAVDAAALDAAENGAISLDLPNGMAFDMSAQVYARDWCLSQFYFHIIAAYSIMRAQGVPLGKADFLSYMMSHMRKPA